MRNAIPTRIAAALFLTTIAAGLFACDNGAVTDPYTDPSPFAATLEVIGGNQQSAVVGTQVSSLLEVRVRDKDGKPYSGAPVVWSVEDERATLLEARTRTDKEGIARNGVIMGVRAGSITIRARVEGSAAEAATFTLTALPADPSKIEPATGFVGIPGDTLTIGVKIQDVHGNGVPDVTVLWGGTGVVNASSKSNVDGIATTAIALPLSPTQFDLVVVVGELSDTFSVRAAQVQLQALAGTQQSTSVGEPWPIELEVLVTDVALGNVTIPNVIVGWSVVSGSPTLEAYASKTDENGIARMKVNAGPVVGTEVVRAFLGNVAVTFKADVVAMSGSRSWHKLSGDNQHGRVGTALPEPFAVQILDARGVPVPGLEVEWTKKPGSKGTIMQHTSVTDPAGIATMIGTLGLTVQDTLVVWATMPAFSDTLEFRAIATSDGLPVFLVKDDRTDGQQGGAYEFVPNPIRVQVLDIDRHPVVGALVKWRLHDGSGNPCADCGYFGQSGNATAQSYTDANGFTEMTWALGPRMGPQHAEAYVPGLGPSETVQFVAYGMSRNLAADILPFDPYVRFSGVRNTELADTLTVIVVDSVRSPVPGVAVSWAVTAGDGVIRHATTTTNELGIAVNTFRLGDSGTNTVRATLKAINKSVDFDVRGTYSPEKLLAVGGNNQTLRADSAAVVNGVMFPVPLRVQVLDRDNVPVKNAVVVVAATQGGGGVSVDGESFGSSLEVHTDYDGYVAVLRRAQELGDIRTSFALKGTFTSVTFEGVVEQR